MEDAAPRRTPPPKPAVLGLSTPKHAVPEVSLMYDSESSLMWQPTHRNAASTTTTDQPHTTTNTTRANPTSEFSRTTARWPQPQPTLDFLHHGARPAKGVRQISPLAAPRPTGAQRLTPGHKAAQNIRLPYTSPPVHPDKEYNPQHYSPLAKQSPQITQDTQTGPQRDSPAGGQVTSNRVRFSPAYSVPGIAGVPQGSHVGTLSSGKNVHQDALNTHTGTLSSALSDARQNPSSTLRAVPVVRDVRQGVVGTPGLAPSAETIRQERAMEGMQGTTQPLNITQASHIPTTNAYKTSYPVERENGYTRLQTPASSTPPSHTYIPAPPLISTSSTTRPTTYSLASTTAPSHSYRPAPPPLVSTSSTIRPAMYPPASTAAPSYNPAPPVSTNTRTATYPQAPSTGLNDAPTDYSSPYLPQPRPENYPTTYNNANWSSPVPASLQTPPTNQYIPQGPEYMGAAWGHHLEHHYSPSLPTARLPHSSADPVVYGLIDDQKQQILKLTKDLQKIMEKQAKEEEEEEEEDRMPRGTRRGRSSQKLDRSNATTQTQEKPAMISVGINTDISWPDLLASLRYQEEEEESDATDPRYRDQDRNEWLRDLKMSRDQVPSHQHFTRRRNSVESAFETSDDSRGGSESSSGQEWIQQQGKPTPTPTPPNITRDHMRGDTGGGRHRPLQSVQGPSSDTPPPGTSPPPSPTPPPQPPTGTTFYHNVLTNIQQILQHTNPSQEQHQQQQQHQQVMPSQAMVVRAGTGESGGGGGGSGGGPDPQIEAVRRQLLNFGVSFLDPATLTPSHRPLVDSLYLPGIHNTVSLYQTSLTTTATHLHHHPCDATAAKYLTDTQLAAIAAASPAMKKQSDQPGGPAPLPPGLPPTQHLYRLHPDDSDNNNNNNDNSVSMATRKFLEKYGLQED
ncbi:uncharacterized protein LOC126983623 [Eriocheir sinensis]|uniref:uncharacterized protein LOC126983623 n=1 Tax=Eriocheir sinensis TaxID=95602 RepID=UPI0021C8C746|nr:uncharacterized protein LOC126983623 [Eriocheir sinensis]XP_050692431.1 uncharacterized protein LOC126983623 [Eriocheir sinensis]